MQDDDYKTPEQLAQDGERLLATLNSFVHENDALEKQEILAQLFLQENTHPDFYNMLLKDVRERYIGALLSNKIPHYQYLVSSLDGKGAVKIAWDVEVQTVFNHTVTVSDMDHGNVFKELLDIEVTAENDGRYETSVLVQAMALRCGVGDYLVVINERDSRRTLHIRRFWPELSDSLLQEVATAAASGNAEQLLQVATRLEVYANDVPGVTKPTRYSLKSLTDGSMVIGHKHGGLAFQFGDSRDCGYVLSTKSNDGQSIAVDLTHLDVKDLAFIANTLTHVGVYCDDLQP